MASADPNTTASGQAATLMSSQQDDAKYGAVEESAGKPHLLFSNFRESAIFVASPPLHCHMRRQLAYGMGSAVQLHKDAMTELTLRQMTGLPLHEGSGFGLRRRSHNDDQKSAKLVQQ